MNKSFKEIYIRSEIWKFGSFSFHQTEEVIKFLLNKHTFCNFQSLLYEMMEMVINY